LSQELLDRANDDDNFLKSIITGDEKWVYGYEGVVHYEFLPQGRTANKEYYLEVMQRLREAVRKKRPDAWRENRWMLQHDNAPSHSSFLVRDFLAKHATIVIPQPPYSPDLAPADLFLFPKFKSKLKGCCFESTEAIKTNSLERLRSIPKIAFQECFRTLKKC
jgi:histone-lysine N-methyltransferase SETMAR